MNVSAFVFRRIYVLISMLYFVYFSYISILEKSGCDFTCIAFCGYFFRGFFAEPLQHHGNLLLESAGHLQDVLWPL